MGEQSGPSGGVGALPGAHPAAIAVEAVKAAGMLLQWWELRKQTLLQGAQFEERRIPWLYDMLAQWASELKEEQLLRADTLTFLDREIIRLLAKISENPLVDVPSSLLLQIDRSANVLVGIKYMLNQLYLSAGADFIIPGSPDLDPFEYKPYYSFKEDSESEYEAYVGMTGGVIAASSAIGAVGLIPFIAPAIAVGPMLWSAALLFKARKASNGKQRLESFAPLKNLALEVRSANSLTRLIGSLQPGLRAYPNQDPSAAGILVDETEPIPA